MLAEQHARAQLDLAAADPEARVAPADPVDAGDRAEEQDEDGEGEQRVRDRLLERVATAVVAAGRPSSPEEAAEAEGGQEVVEQLGRGVAQDRQQHDASAQQRRERVEPLPLPRGLRNRFGHRPARCASPRAARRLRSASASATGSPGSEPPLSGEAVWISHEAMPWARASGPDWMSTYCRRP